MSKDSFFRISGLFAFVLLFMSVDVFGQIYTYDFGTGTGTADGSNANNGGAGITNFFTGTPTGGGTYRLRIDAHGGSMVLDNPGTTLGSDTEAKLTASSFNTTVVGGAPYRNIMGVYDWDAPSETFYLRMNLRTSSIGAGVITIAIGNSNIGSTNAMLTTDALALIKLKYDDTGALTLTRSAKAGDTPFMNTDPVIIPNTDHVIEFYANSSVDSKSYSKNGVSYTLGTMTWDLWIDNKKCRNGSGYVKAQRSTVSGNITGFGISGSDSPGNTTVVNIDDIFYATQFPPFETTVWNGVSWSKGRPNSDTIASINGDYDTSVNGNFTANQLFVMPGATLNIDKNNSVWVMGKLENSGTINVQSDGNLVQVGNFTNVSGNTTGENIGAITLHREARMKRLDYTNWGAPVRNQNLFGFSPGTLTNRFYMYDEATDGFVNAGLNAGSVFEPATGYVIRAPNTFPANYSQTDPANLFTGKFIGVPNSGKISTVLKKLGMGFNLVSNPYPSNIDFRVLRMSNANHNAIDYTAHFWTNVDLSNVPVGYEATKYAVYNSQNNTGVPATNGTQIPTAIIKPGQGFYVTARVNNGILTFNNSVRTANNNGVFFNVALRGGVYQNPETNRYWLRMTTPLGIFNTMAVVYSADDSNSNQEGADSPLIHPGSDAFYAYKKGNRNVIDGRTPFKKTDKVSLGFISFQPGSHKISLGMKEGVFQDDQPVILHDKLLGTFTNLQTDDYDFETKKGEDNERFEIVYQQNALLETGNIAKSSVSVYRDLEFFVVKSAEKILSIQLYDMAGKLVSVLRPNSPTAQIDTTNLPRGNYFLSVSLSDGTVLSKKIIK